MPRYLAPINEYGYHTSVTGYLPPHEAEGLTEYAGQTLPCWPDGTPLTEQELADIAEQKEQARLQQVATDYAVPLQQFADAWAETGVETVPESWDDAFVLLKQSGVSADVFCELLALRLGALAPVWDDVLIILNGGM